MMDMKDKKEAQQIEEHPMSIEDTADIQLLQESTISRDMFPISANSEVIWRIDGIMLHR